MSLIAGFGFISVERCTVEGFKLVRGMGEAGVDAGLRGLCTVA